MDIQVPLFRDKNTPEFMNGTTNGNAKGAPELPEGYNLEPDTNIHMDAMGFGMGMSCLVSKLLFFPTIMSIYNMIFYAF